MEQDFKLSDNIPVALTAVDPSYVYHVTHGEEWDSILLMEINGIAFGRIYWFHNDNTTVTLDFLSVNEEARRNKHGTFLQIMREKMAVLLGAKYVTLWTNKTKWMYDWYCRRGYTYWENGVAFIEEENAVWMRKTL